MSDYRDIDGNPVALDKLTRDEPAWAANVIRSLRTKLEAAEAERDEFGNVIAGLLVELGHDHYLDEEYVVADIADTTGEGRIVWQLMKQDQDSFGPYFRKISNHLMAIDAVRAWLEVRGEVDND